MKGSEAKSDMQGLRFARATLVTAQRIDWVQAGRNEGSRQENMTSRAPAEVVVTKERSDGF